MTGNPCCDLSCQSLPRTFFITWKHRGKWAKHVPEISMLDCSHSASSGAPWTPDIKWKSHLRIRRRIKVDKIPANWRRLWGLAPHHLPHSSPRIGCCVSDLGSPGSKEFNLCCPIKKEPCTEGIGPGCHPALCQCILELGTSSEAPVHRFGHGSSRFKQYTQERCSNRVKWRQPRTSWASATGASSSCLKFAYSGWCW